MTDWTQELLKRQPQKVSQNTNSYTDQITVFRLLANDQGWEKLPWIQVNDLTLKRLCSEPYLFKMKTGQYFCGSDEVWEKLADKPRTALVDLFQGMVDQWKHRGASLRYFWDRSWQMFLCTIWAMKYLKATLITDKEEVKDCVRPKP